MKRSAGIFAMIALVVFSVVFGAVVSTSAQTKKKPVKKTPTPRPVATQTVPVIVSQADRYTQQNQQIITGSNEPIVAPETVQPQETLDEKLDRLSNRLKEMNMRMKSLESTKQNQYDDAQKRLLLNLDILTRAEQRAESLRKQLFDLMEKENTIRNRMEIIDYESRSEVVERGVAMTGSLRPEELRDLRRKSLETEKRNLQSLLTEIQNTKVNLEQNVVKADQMVERLRVVLEKEIDAALTVTKEEQ